MGDGAAALDERVASNSFQMSLRVGDDATEVIEVALSQVAAWLRTQKGWDAVLTGNGFQRQLRENRDLLTLHRESSEGRDFRVRLTEATRLGVWKTQLTVHVPSAGGSWVALQVGNSEGRWTAVPNLAAYLLDSVPLMDGTALLSSDALVVGPGNVDEFLDQLCDPTRRGLFFVAGTSNNDIDFSAFRRKVSKWGRQVRGLAQVAVLSPEATDAVASALGRDHAVAPWTLRTFQPDVDPAVRADALRHKFLTTERLGRERDDLIQQLLGRIARRHAFLRPSFDGWASADRALRRLEDRTLVDSIAAFLPTVPVTEDGLAVEDEVSVAAGLTVEVPDTVEELLEQAGDAAPAVEPALVGDGPEPPADEPLHTVAPEDPSPEETAALRAEVESTRHEVADLAALVEMVKSELGLGDLTPDALRQFAARAAQAEAVTANVQQVKSQLRERGQQIADLEDRLELLTLAYEESQLDERIAASDAKKTDDENRWLRSRLNDAGDFEGAYGLIPEEAYTTTPSNWAELLSRLSEFDAAGVVFTGDTNELLALDTYDTVGKVASVAWQAFLTLADYVRARREGVCDTNVKQYLRETPNGYQSMPPKKYAEGETNSTMQQWGDLRDFPVPEEVHPSKSILMEAHFKLGRVGMVSPRMYYLDRYSSTGKVYVGYVGAHLRNTMSN